MNYTRKGSEHGKSGNRRFPVGTLLFSIIIIQASVTCGANPQVGMPPARAVALVSCVNPTLSNNNVLQATATPGIVLINEVLTTPISPWACTMPNGSTYNQEHRWIEIYNPQDQPLDLYAAHATIDQGQGTKSSFVPSGSIIEAHGFLVLFPFVGALSISQVRLTISQVVIDQVSSPSLPADTSYARIPDGSDNWQVTTTPTIASSNILNGITSSNQTPGTGQTASGTTNAQNRTSRQKSTNIGDKASPDTSNTGVQPTWSALRLPGSGSNNAATNNTTQHNASPSAIPSDPFDLLKKILFTLLIVVFPFALLWGWRLYKKRYRNYPPKVRP